MAPSITFIQRRGLRSQRRGNLPFFQELSPERARGLHPATSPYLPPTTNRVCSILRATWQGWNGGFSPWFSARGSPHH